MNTIFTNKRKDDKRDQHAILATKNYNFWISPTCPVFGSINTI